MDLTRLNGEYNSYWLLHSKQKAIENLKQIDSYLSEGHNDTFLLPYESLLSASYLAGRYNQDLGISFDEIAANVSYKDLLSHFRDYIQKLINESIAIDEAHKQYLSELNKGLFEDIFSAAKGAIKNVLDISAYMPYIIIGGIILFLLIYYFKKGK